VKLQYPCGTPVPLYNCINLVLLLYPVPLYYSCNPVLLLFTCSTPGLLYSRTKPVHLYYSCNREPLYYSCISVSWNTRDPLLYTSIALLSLYTCTICITHVQLLYPVLLYYTWTPVLLLYTCTTPDHLLYIINPLPLYYCCTHVLHLYAYTTVLHQYHCTRNAVLTMYHSNTHVS